MRSTQVAPTRIDNRKVAIDHLGKRFLPPRASAEAGEIAKDYPVECKEREAEIATEISLAENVMHALAIGYHVKTAAAIIDSAVRTGAHGSIPHDPRQRIGAARLRAVILVPATEPARTRLGGTAAWSAPGVSTVEDHLRVEDALVCPGLPRALVQDVGGDYEDERGEQAVKDVLVGAEPCGK